MKAWVKVVPLEEIKEDEFYFISSNTYNRPGEMFWSQGLNGKQQWSVKPGIALRFKGDENFKEVLRKNPNAVAILVPKDADTRWKARKKRYFK